MKLEELLDIIEPSMPGMEPTCSLVEATRLTHTAIINRLLQVKSDVLVEELLIAVPANDDIGHLPDDYQSLARRPQIVGGDFLTVLTSSDTSALETAGTPKYYQIIGKLLQVFPPTDTAINIKLLARLRPAAPALMDDDLPFNGAFDQVYIDGVVAILSGGIKAMNAKTYLQGIQLQVDQIISGAAGDDEQLMADSINGL